MVFSIFALVTLPVRMVRSPRVSVFGAAAGVSVVITPSLLLATSRPQIFPAREGVSSRAPNLFSIHGAASELPPVRWRAGTSAGKSARSALFAALRARSRPLREFFQCALAYYKLPERVM